MATAQSVLVPMTSRPSEAMGPPPTSCGDLPPMTPDPRPRTGRTGLDRILSQAVGLCLPAELDPLLDSLWVSTEEVAEAR